MERGIRSRGDAWEEKKEELFASSFAKATADKSQMVRCSFHSRER